MHDAGMMLSLYLDNSHRQLKYLPLKVVSFVLCGVAARPIQKPSVSTSTLTPTGTDPDSSYTLNTLRCILFFLTRPTGKTKPNIPTATSDWM
jgi:hypothetical protein